MSCHYGKSVCGDDSGVKKNESYPTVSHTYTTNCRQVSPIDLDSWDNNSKSRETKVRSGLEFLLSHFSEPLFPRTVSTAATKRRQYKTPDKDTGLYYYKAALSEDCRISAFGVQQTNPDLIFIDLDTRDFVSMKALKTALTKTRNHIKNKLNGYPTVIWSGRGYHIIQPIDCPVNLDEINEFATLTDDGDVNKKFLQFAERYLTGNKNDGGHHAALKSCMLRVPGSLNSKCKEAGIDAEVKIVRRWDGYRPDYRLLIGTFYADLRGKYEKELSKYQRIVSNYALGHDSGPIGWIEKLLQTPIDDFRKRSRDLILVPYFVVIRGMTNADQITQIILKWADKCAELYKLEPSRREYQKRIRSRVKEVMRDRIPPMRLETLKEKNPELYDKLTTNESLSNL